jgi:hypothetical protein
LGKGEGVSSVVKLGKLELVDLRTAWPHEALNFTKWLAENDNLAMLGEALGLELTCEAVEKAVDNFSADILAKDVVTDRWVLIENQLEMTDHSHLGQILTYAAGLDAETIIWIAREFREPHRAAIDYLNRITAPEFNFFGVQIELLRIGDSAFAPRFNILAKPNDWSKSVSARAAGKAAVSGLHQEWQDYWSDFFSVAEDRGLKLKNRVPPKEGWCRIEQLCSGARNAASWLHWSDKRLRVLIWLQGEERLDLFDELYAAKSLIESAIDTPLSWERFEHKKSSFISLDGPTPAADDNYALDYQWYIDSVTRLTAAVRPYIGAKQ